MFCAPSGDCTGDRLRLRPRGGSVVDSEVERVALRCCCSWSSSGTSRPSRTRSARRTSGLVCSRAICEDVEVLAEAEGPATLLEEAPAEVCWNAALLTGLVIQRRVCRLRLEATPNRRPQILQTKAIQSERRFKQ